MKKTMYDFSMAIIELEQWYKPSELSIMLKNAALELASLTNGLELSVIANMQKTVLDVCCFLDAVVEKEVEQ